MSNPKGKIFPDPPQSAAPFSAPIDRERPRGGRNGFDGTMQLGGLLQDGGARTNMEHDFKLVKRMSNSAAACASPPRRSVTQCPLDFLSRRDSTARIQIRWGSGWLRTNGEIERRLWAVADQLRAIRG
jgi:hypothetical protein